MSLCQYLPLAGQGLRAQHRVKHSVLATVLLPTLLTQMGKWGAQITCSSPRHLGSSELGYKPGRPTFQSDLVSPGPEWQHGQRKALSECSTHSRGTDHVYTAGQLGDWGPVRANVVFIIMQQLRTKQIPSQSPICLDIALLLPTHAWYVR